MASVCNMQVCVDEVNGCDCDMNDVDADDGDEVSGRVHNMVPSDCVNDDDVLRPVHTVDDGEVSASDVKDECKVRCEVVEEEEKKLLTTTKQYAL